MNQNKTIIEKIIAKTEENPAMRRLISELIIIETEGGQYNKRYKQLIEKTAKESD